GGQNSNSLGGYAWFGRARDLPNPPITVTVTTAPAGRTVTVDGSTYATPQTFNWRSGDTHTISTSSPQAGATGTQYAFSSWSDGGSQTHLVTPTTNTTFTASFTTQYLLTTAVSPVGDGS